MSYQYPGVAEARQTPRLKLPAMYTLLRLKPRGDDRFKWTGHIYDISTGGMRFEMDTDLPAGTEIEVRAMLPGATPTTVTASGRIVRLHEDDPSLPPVRMAMTFDTFSHPIDRQKLCDYLTDRGLRLAA
jgi:c-di-GMP-binding flagellar brake protein YcgR